MSTKQKHLFITCHFALLFILVLVGFIHIYRTNVFNSEYHSAYSNADKGACYLDLGPRTAGDTSWTRPDTILGDRTCTLVGITYDGTLYNYSEYDIDDWAVKINITNDCYISSAWCGTVEIHQSVNGAKLTDELDLRNCNPDEIDLKHYIADVDILIPLSAGDYVIYHPNKETYEKSIKAFDVYPGSVTIGANFYYEQPMVINDYELIYRYHKGLFHGVEPIVFFGLLIIWFIILIAFGVYVYSYDRAKYDIRHQIFGISTMSKLYDKIYLIDIINQSYVLISNENSSTEFQKADLTECKNKIIEDAVDVFKDAVNDFLDLDTVEERLANKRSILCDFKSKSKGWCQFRLVAVNQAGSIPLEKLLLTIQVVNDEREEKEKRSELIDSMIAKNKEKNDFLREISMGIKAPLEEIIDISQSIDDEYADSITNPVKVALTLIDSAINYTYVDENCIQITNTSYSLAELINEVVQITNDLLSQSNNTLSLDVTPELPSVLIGDYEKLKQILVNIILFSTSHTQDGEIKLCIYGKVDEDNVHLLFSIKDNGSLNETVSDSKEFRFCNKELNCMNSELKCISVENQGNDTYFSLEQGVVDFNSIGETN